MLTKKPPPFAPQFVLLSSPSLTLSILASVTIKAVLLHTPITVDPTTRPTGIAYFVFQSTVDPSTIDTSITKSSITIEFWLALPQTILTVARPAPDPGHHNLTFKTPAGALAPGQASTTVRLSRNNLQALSAADLADLDSTTGGGTLADYDPKQLLRFVHYNPVPNPFSPQSKNHSCPCPCPCSYTAIASHDRYPCFH
jgi:hypothetical protein